MLKQLNNNSRIIIIFTMPSVDKCGPLEPNSMLNGAKKITFVLIELYPI